MAKLDLKAHVTGAVVALAVVGLASPQVGLAHSTASAMRRLEKVFVANSEAHPVPVRTVGTTDVNVANVVPVQQQGTLDVNVVNASNPGGVTPVQRTAFGTFPSGSGGSDTIDLYTVPDGKLLILETFSIVSNLAGPDQRLMHVTFTVEGATILEGLTVNVIPFAEGIFAGTGANIFRATLSATAYAGPGTTVSARGTRTGTDIAHLDSLGVGIAGRLVDVVVP